MVKRRQIIVKFFIDTANLEQIKKAYDVGVIDGVTTNPSLISREGDVDFHSHLKEICDLVDGPVNGEVISLEAEGMVEEGRELADIAPNIVVKIPMTMEGLKAVNTLSNEGITTNVTLVFSPNQALLAAKAGANYASPFVGRLDDRAHDGMQLIHEIATIYDNYGLDTEIIVASVRRPNHVKESAMLGADIATIPFDVIDKLSQHPLTDIGIQRFLDDWEEVQG